MGGEEIHPRRTPIRTSEIGNSLWQKGAVRPLPFSCPQGEMLERRVPLLLHRQGTELQPSAVATGFVPYRGPRPPAAFRPAVCCGTSAVIRLLWWATCRPAVSCRYLPSCRLWWLLCLSLAVARARQQHLRLPFAVACAACYPPACCVPWILPEALCLLRGSEPVKRDFPGARLFVMPA